MIDQTGLYAEILNYDSGSSITNEGTIEAELKGGTFTISNYAFTNAGTIDIANGDTVNLGNGMTSFVNTGGTIDARRRRSRSICREAPSRQAISGRSMTAGR